MFLISIQFYPLGWISHSNMLTPTYWAHNIVLTIRNDWIQVVTLLIHYLTLNQRYGFNVETKPYLNVDSTCNNKRKQLTRLIFNVDGQTCKTQLHTLFLLREDVLRLFIFCQMWKNWIWCFEINFSCIIWFRKKKIFNFVIFSSFYWFF